MTKQEILDKFSDIDFVYNDSSKHETLSRMLDELLKEQETEISRISNAYLELVGKASKQPQIVRCKDCKHYYLRDRRCFNRHSSCRERVCRPDWFCAEGEKRDG